MIEIDISYLIIKILKGELSLRDLSIAFKLKANLVSIKGYLLEKVSLCTEGAQQEGTNDATNINKHVKCAKRDILN